MTDDLEARIKRLEDWNVVQKDWNRKVNARQSKVESELKVLGTRIASAGGGTGTFTPPVVEPTTPVPPPVAVEDTYGAAVGLDTQANHRITDDGAVTWREQVGSAVTAVGLQVRQGSGYSAGERAAWAITIEEEDGTVIGTGSYMPTASVNVFPLIAITGCPSLTIGDLYRVRYTNTHASPASNYVSVNHAINWDGGVQPGLSADLAVYRNGTATPAYTPVIDIVYANGAHEGSQYHEAMYAQARSIGGSNQVRERFTYTGTDGRAFTELWVRVARISGSSPLTLTLKEGSTTVASGSIASTSIRDIAQSARGSYAGNMTNFNLGWLPSGTWAKLTTSFALDNGSTYDLVLTSAGSYLAVPIREVANELLTGAWGSRAFTDGRMEYSTNGGSGWSAAYFDNSYNPTDLQWYAK
jgi:hypothetical protein